MIIARDKYNLNDIEGPPEFQMSGLAGMPTLGSVPSQGQDINGPMMPVNRAMPEDRPSPMATMSAPPMMNNAPAPAMGQPMGQPKPSFFGQMKQQLSQPKAWGNISNAISAMRPQRKPMQLPNFNRTTVPMGGNQGIRQQQMFERKQERPTRMMSY